MSNNFSVYTAATHPVLKGWLFDLRYTWVDGEPPFDIELLHQDFWDELTRLAGLDAQLYAIGSMN